MASSNLKPPSILLMGPAGAGKTWSLGSLVKAGIEVFVLVTEPNGADTLLDVIREQKLDRSKLHWHTVSPTTAGLDSLKAMARTIQNSNYEDIAKIKNGPAKSEQRQMMAFLEALEDFTDDSTGESFGDVFSWGPERALVIDSLSGLNAIAMTHTIGLKPSAHQGEWGIAMNLEEQILLKLTADCKCWLVLTAHVDKEPNEITGISQVTVSALGRKLAPKISRFFSEVVLARRGKDAFLWSTAEDNTDLKNRALPVSSALSPDFGQIVRVYKERVTLAAT